MPRRSRESERPIMAPSLAPSDRTSKRLSMFSASPSFDSINSSSTATITAETGMAEIKELRQGLDRLENKQLNEQRYVPNQQKTDEISKLSLGAKVERALERRMSNQDAVLKVKRINNSSKGRSGMSVMSEKTAISA